MKTALTLDRSPLSLTRLWWFSLIGVILVAVLVLGLRAVQSSGEGGDVSKMSQAAFEDVTGVRIVRLAVTGGGGLIDMRYQVVDPDKALVVHSLSYPPAIIDEGTGRSLATVFHSHRAAQLRRGFHAGVTYYLLFRSPGDAIERGDRVSIKVGSARLEHVPVQ